MAALLFAPGDARHGPKPERIPTHERLHAQCLLYAADPKNPWAMAHGMVGLGRDFGASDGRRAADAIIHDFLKKGDVPLGSPYGFDRFAADQTPIEPHANLITKTLVLAGYPLSARFPAAWGSITLGELVKSVEYGYRHVPTNDGYWREVGWTLDLLAHVLQPGPTAHFTDSGKEDIDFNRVMDDALAYLERAQSAIAAGMDQGLPSVAKDKQGIYAHHCGGMHFIQAVNHWARYPAVRSRWGLRWAKQLDVLFYRLDSERQQYEAALQAMPQYKLDLLTQELKFYGHWLETTGRLEDETGIPLSPEKERTVARARALLDHTVRELEAIKAFDTMAELEASKYQTYLDLIGDSCHATNGLDYWRRLKP